MPRDKVAEVPYVILLTAHWGLQGFAGAGGLVDNEEITGGNGWQRVTTNVAPDGDYRIIATNTVCSNFFIPSI